MANPTVGEVRLTVIARDLGCVATRVDPKAGTCHDQWGHAVYELPLDDLEMDYVRFRARAGHHVDPADHVALCPGHHRGMGAQRGYVWATSHRAQLRDYLDRLDG